MLPKKVETGSTISHLSAGGHAISPPTCSMTVDSVERIGICNGDLPRANSNVFAVLAMSGIQNFKASAEAGMVDELKEPENMRKSCSALRKSARRASCVHCSLDLLKRKTHPKIGVSGYKRGCQPHTWSQGS